MHLPVFETTGHIVEYCWANRGAIARFSAIPVSIVVALSLIANGAGVNLEDPTGPGAIALSLISALVYLPLTVTWYRLVIFGPEDVQSRPMFALGVLEFRLLGWQIAIAAMLLSIGVAGMAIIVFIAGALGASGGPGLGQFLLGAGGGAWALFVISAMCRLSIALAMAASGRPVSLPEAWARTTGLGVRMTGVFVLLMLAALVLFVPLQAIVVVVTMILSSVTSGVGQSVGFFLGLIAGAIGGIAILVLETTLFALVYQRIADALTQAQTDEASRDVPVESSPFDRDAEVDTTLTRIADLLKKHPKESTADLRALMDALGDAFPLPPGTVTEELDCDGVPARWIGPPGASSETVIVYLHGGGFSAGSAQSHQRVAADIAAAADGCALVVEYRLAPEHPYPAGLEDCLTVYRWLIGQGIRPDRIALAGDSAGGNLVVTLCLAIDDARMPLPRAMVALSPWVNLECNGETMETKAEDDPIATREALMTQAGYYLGETDPRDPMVSPIYADLSGMPPLLIQVGSREILLDDSRRLATRARADDVEVQLEEWAGMFHDFQMFADWLTDGRRAIDGIGMFLRRQFDGSP